MRIGLRLEPNRIRRWHDALAARLAGRGHAVGVVFAEPGPPPDATALLFAMERRLFSGNRPSGMEPVDPADVGRWIAPPEAAFDVVIDHHPLTAPGGRLFSDVRPTYGSTSTIMTEYYQASGTRLSKKLATALFYGLKIDTGNLTRNVSDADVAAFRYLRMRNDENLVRTIELSPVTM